MSIQNISTILLDKQQYLNMIDALTPIITLDKNTLKSRVLQHVKNGYDLLVNFYPHPTTIQS